MKRRVLIVSMLLALLLPWPGQIGAQGIEPPGPVVLGERQSAELPPGPLPRPPEVGPAPLSLTQVLTAATEAHLLEGYPSAGCGRSSVMMVGYDDMLDPDGRIARGLIEFPITMVPPGMTIARATLQVLLVESWDYEGASRTITTYRATSPWAEGIVGWNNAPGLGEAYGSFSAGHGDWQWYSSDVTNLVRGWYSGTYPNYGLYLRGPEHSGNDSSWKGFGTGDVMVGDEIAWPRLVIEYDVAGSSPKPASLLSWRAAPGVEPAPQYSGEPQSAGTAGPTRGSLAPVVWLPLVTNSYPWPPVPAASQLNPIDNDGGEGEYLLIWTAASGATSYTLQEWATSAWQDLYSGPNLSFAITGRAPGTYRYRVLARNAWGYSTSAEQAAAVSDADHGMVVLVIGINDYQYMDSPGPAGLRAGAPGYDLTAGTLDALDMFDTSCACGSIGGAATLAGADCGGPDSNVAILTDYQATKVGIQRAITEWVDARETRNTTVLLYFSGHGTFGPDVAPLDEPADNLDEYIAPQDLRCNPCGATPEQTTWVLETAIRDDELALWLAELSSQRLVFIFDSCFSGGMLASPGLLSRGLASPQASPAALPQGGDGLLADVAQPGREIISASRADQPSAEFAALRNGAFTYYLVEALQSPTADANHNGKVSAEEAYAYTRDRVDQLVFSATGGHQNPQIADGVAGDVDLTTPVLTTGCPDTQ
jgi:hypothetical protein